MFNSNFINYLAQMEEPPGVGPVILEVLGWVKWIAIFCGVGGFFVIAIMMMIGRRNRSQMAADGMSALPWIVGGFLLIGISSSFAHALIDAGEGARVNLDGNSDIIANLEAPDCVTVVDPNHPSGTAQSCGQRAILGLD